MQPGKRRQGPWWREISKHPSQPIHNPNSISCSSRPSLEIVDVFCVRSRPGCYGGEEWSQHIPVRESTCHTRLLACAQERWFGDSVRGKETRRHDGRVQCRHMEDGHITVEFREKCDLGWLIWRSCWGHKLKKRFQGSVIDLMGLLFILAWKGR